MAEGNLVRVGDQAPEFTLPTADGGMVSLSDYRGRSEVVLFFYPKDDSPVCTAQACSFRDHYEAFREAGAEVLGVSADTADSHRAFAGRHRLPFPLLSDPGGSVRARYGVPKTLGLFPGRTTFLIDRAGVVRHAFTAQLLPFRHVPEMLGVLRGLRDGQGPAAG